MKIGVESYEWYPYYDVVEVETGRDWGEVIDLTKEEYDMVIKTLKEVNNVQRFLKDKYMAAYEKRKKLKQ